MKAEMTSMPHAETQGQQARIGPSSFPVPAAGYPCVFWFSKLLLLERLIARTPLQLSATDVSARTTMKGAAKCDKHCELQNSVNQ